VEVEAMSTGVELLERLDAEFATVQEQTATREREIMALLERTRAHWQAWAEQWAGMVRVLEERQAALAGKDAAAAEMVTAAEIQLDEAEAALREWLAMASVAAKETQPRGVA
jgi:sugar phosphate isomerase/epimerase